MKKIASKGMEYVLILLFILLPLSKVSSQTWKNPMIMDKEWAQYGMGDPYIFKYRGTFYLYVSTKNREIGAKCWSSKDLVDWQYEGNVTKDSTMLGAYAPEVMYWNGKFYMYSSPRGRGHYVYKANSPTGPFVRVTENFGKRIDGSVFIDDDGQWYFYHASDEGIQAAEMSSPLTFEDSKKTGAWMNKTWTEGSSVIKRNGIYHMIYTGNHINSRGYRIDYASSQSSPISDFKPHQDQNPIILATENDAFKGLGHGTWFIGPDLDSYYITYHNHVSRRGPVRQYNFDRITWNGDKARVLGPTTFSQEAPKLPSAYDYFDRENIGEDWKFPNGGIWSVVDQNYLLQDLREGKHNPLRMAVFSATTDKNYTAEFNFKELDPTSNSKLGTIINYRDKRNFGIIAVNNTSKQLEINFLTEGKWDTPELVNIQPDLDFTQWQTMRVEKFGSDYKVFIHDLLIYQFSRDLPNGKIGYFTNGCRGAFGFIAFSNHVQGSAIFDVYKPIPGTLDAIHYNSGGEGKGYHDKTTGTSELYIRKDSVDKVESSLGGYGVDVQTGEWLNYNINVASANKFNARIIYASSVSNSQLKLFLDENDISGVVDLPLIKNANWGSVIVKNLEMNQGSHMLKVKAVNGSFGLYALKFQEANNEPIQQVYDFDDEVDKNWSYIDGDWSISDGVLSSGSTGKRITGDYNWSDYTIEVDIKYVNGLDAGLIFRARNPAQGRAGNSPDAGIDFFQGYYAHIENERIILSKHNYNKVLLASSPINVQPGHWYHLKAKISGNKISLFVNNKNDAALEYEDLIPLMGGGVGFRVNQAKAMFDDLIITNE